MPKLSNTDSNKSFSIDARIILNLGRESIKDHTTALIELVKNSYDADATKVEIEIFCNSENPFIRISDNGHGMTEKVVDESWLRIGYSVKRKAKISFKDRRKTGEKGIGRLSSDRLGSVLDLKSKAKNKKSIGLKVNWNDFNVDGQELTKVPIQFIESPELNLPTVSKKKSKTGTELIISKLRHNWSAIDIENLYEELSLLTPPFKKVVDFSINLSTDVVDGYSKKIQSPFYRNAEIELKATFNGTDDTISYKIKDKYGLGSKRKLLIPWAQLIQRIGKASSPELPFSNKLNCGPVEITFLFYPRDISIIEGTGFKLPDLKEFLDKNAGVKIYRDNIRVKPYGNQNESEGDWLGLSNRKQKRPDGIAKPTWVAGGHQIIGGVFITRDGNKNLVDSASREGLIDGQALYDLRAISLGCLTLLETHRHLVHKKIKNKADVKNKPAVERVANFQKKLESIKDNFEALITSIPKSEKKKVATAIKEVKELIETTDDSANKVIEELIGQNRLLGALATIGIASAIFGHETESSIGGIGGSVKAAMVLLSKRNPDIPTAIEELEKTMKYSKLVNAWGKFALTRIKKNKRKRRKVNLENAVSKLLNEFEPAFKGANITIARNLEEVHGIVFQMDIETIIINLLTNAYSILSTLGKERKIIVELKNYKKEKDGFIISVEDSGYGINDKFVEKIWEPLFTLKKNKNGRESGTGLGLSIISSIITEANGTKEIIKSKKLGGAKLVFWMPKR